MKTLSQITLGLFRSPVRFDLGSKMEDTKAKEIAAICGKKGITVYKMEMAKDKVRADCQTLSGP